MSAKITEQGLQTFLDKLLSKFSKKGHGHIISSVDGLEQALENAGKIKTINEKEPDENGNVDLSEDFSSIKAKLAKCIYVKDRHLYLGSEEEIE